MMLLIGVCWIARREGVHCSVLRTGVVRLPAWGVFYFLLLAVYFFVSVVFVTSRNL